MVSTFIRRNMPGPALGLLLCLGILSICPVALAQDTYSPGDKVIIDVVNADLETVIHLLSKQTSIQMVMAASPDDMKKKVTVHVDGQPIEQVLKNVLTAAGVNYRKTEDGTYIIGAANEPEPVAPKATAVAAQPALDPMVDYVQPISQAVKKSRTEVVRLRHANARDILTIINQDVVPFTPEELMKIERQRWQSRIVSQPDWGQNPAYPSTEPVPPSPNANSAAPTGINEANRSSGLYDAANQYTPGRPGGSSYNRPPSTSGTYRPPSSPGSPGTTTSSGGGLRPEGIDSIWAYDIDNSLIVRGDDDGIAELKEIIHMLDVPPKQVEIKAEFIEVSTNAATALGIDWQLDRLNTAINTTGFAPSTGNVFLGIVRGNWMAQLRTLLTSGKGRIVNSPRISTINNMPASIQIGQEIPVFLSTVIAGSTTTTGTSTQPAIATQLSVRPIQSGLQVVPRINGDDSITMFLQPEISDEGRLFEGPDGQQVPESRTQTLVTNRRVMNGQTMVVGGFIRRSDTSSQKKVPLLSSLPLIGKLFTSETRDTEDRELLIFITPTIIQDSSSSSTGVRPTL